MSLKNYIFSTIRRYQFHLVAWGLFVLYEVTVAGIIYGRLSSFGDYALHYSINIALFYLHALVVMPRGLLPIGHRYWLLPSLIVAEVIAYILFTYAMELLAVDLFQVRMTRSLDLDSAYLLRSAWRAIYFLGFATAYYFLTKYLSERTRVEQIQRQQLLDIIDKQHLQTELIRSQNAFLKAQINPHFLFNTLNYVYNSVRKTSAPAAEAILSLSHMMRYALQSEDEHQQTDLLEEIQQVEHLLHIHRIRQEGRLRILLHYGPNLEGIRFIPLVLITLVENMFKHGDLTGAGEPATITVRYQAGELKIMTVNPCLDTRARGHRIGLDNIRKRLQHAYPGRASFDAWTDEAGFFHTRLCVTT
ncbi:sensor histidine kinase [Pontibacter indicus]|uniref:Histidine kinase n=1 Tax=Pontibacter indicus TaxID=1317125 RepID=A0A1R3XSP4_9BACT|nr:sensor histidine kinase [Pontibacter indicus]SIT94062.1 Histidine kinase [Pontibacter indicus]